MTPQEKLIFRFLLTALIVGLVTGFVRREWFSDTLLDVEEASKMAGEIEAIVTNIKNENINLKDEIVQGNEKTEINVKDSSIIPTGKVNLNNSTKTELMSLPGIGPSIAERIIIYRDDHGHFKKVEDITKVKGIGKTKLGKIRDLVTL
ncbi:MAG: helix-hairpin-helix domain-containing protein [Candidatus Marinimicrobia bacterium]|nr:helix-hairpin-helix domain-containing protein [Candidatus Neomarinimicrobiota bacterium]MCH8067685.1 helix-hairpin-helix domain-containing protein [Candidatus Neomarinimicrobiota bacterium]